MPRRRAVSAMLAGFLVGALVVGCDEPVAQPSIVPVPTIDLRRATAA